MGDHRAYAPTILLTPTGAVSGASGVARLLPAPSPFGVAVSSDGHLVYDLDIRIRIPGEPSRLGPYRSYVAWVSAPSLDTAQKLGAIGSGSPLLGRTSLNKFVLIVSAEASPDVQRRSGPVVLRGISPSGLLQSFRGHSLFETAH